MLEARGISQGYGRATTIQALDLSFTAGVTALLGPNGAGKTTLLETLATVRPPRAGHLLVDGVDIVSEKDARRARRQIGYLPQRFGFDPSMRLRDFVTYGAWVRGVAPRDWRRHVDDALQYVGLSDAQGTKMGRLSGGTRQRAAIAWAIVGRPSNVILDEPTVGLDPQQRLRFRELIRGLAGTTVLLSTHLTDDVDAICDHTVVLSAGACVFDGPTAALRARDDGTRLGHTPLERAYVRTISIPEVAL